MRRRTLGNGAIIVAALATLTGIGVAIANAATNPGGTTASPSASSSSGGSTCSDVFLTTDPAGDTAGKLCLAVDSDSTTVNGVTVTFTASSSCSDSVMLRVSGADSSGAEFGDVKEVACSSQKATASFDPVTKVVSNTFICGTLLADKYTAAQACVTIS